MCIVLSHQCLLPLIRLLLVLYHRAPLVQLSYNFNISVIIAYRFLTEDSIFYSNHITTVSCLPSLPGVF